MCADKKTTGVEPGNAITQIRAWIEIPEEVTEGECAMW